MLHPNQNPQILGDVMADHNSCNDRTCDVQKIVLIHASASQRRGAECRM